MKKKEKEKKLINNDTTQVTAYNLSLSHEVISIRKNWKFDNLMLLSVTVIVKANLQLMKYKHFFVC